MQITSKSNDIIKYIYKLKTKKYRDEEEKYIVEGIKMLEEAIVEKVDIERVLVCEDLLPNPIEDDILDAIKDKCIYVSKDVYKILTDVTTPQGVLVVIKKPDTYKIDFSKDLFLILDDIQDPGNMGTILRTADSIGLKEVIVSKNCVDAYNSKVVRSTMGAIYRVNVIKKDLQDVLNEFKNNKINVYATSLDAKKTIYDVNYKRSAIIVGNESNGVESKIKSKADELIKIPMIGKTESLNVAVATGIILYNAILSI